MTTRPTAAALTLRADTRRAARNADKMVVAEVVETALAVVAATSVEKSKYGLDSHKLI